MQYYYNCTPSRQFVIFKTCCGNVGYGWPLPEERCCRRRRRKHCDEYGFPFWQYPYCKDFSCISPFGPYGGFPFNGYPEIGRGF